MDDIVIKAPPAPAPDDRPGDQPARKRPPAGRRPRPAPPKPAASDPPTPPDPRPGGLDVLA